MYKFQNVWYALGFEVKHSKCFCRSFRTYIYINFNYGFQDKLFWLYYFLRGRRVIGIFGSPIWSKTQMELILNPCGKFRWSLEGPVSQIHPLHLQAGIPGIFSDLLRSVQMLKREWGEESNGKLPYLSIPIKTAGWVPEFAVEDLPLSRTAAFVPEFAVKDLPLGRILWWSDDDRPTIIYDLIFSFWL